MGSVPANRTRLRADQSALRRRDARPPSRVTRLDRGKFGIRPDRRVGRVHLDRLAREKIDEPTLDPRTFPSAFERAPKKSIDQAVMERTARAGVVPASFDWCDVGTWTSVWETSERTDPDGNVTRGAIELVETTNSLVFGDGVLAAAVGLDDAIVVATPDAVLVASKEHAHRVKSLVDEMRRRNRSQASEHLRVHRPWGWFQRVDHGPRFQVKRIVIKPGSSLSLQKHFHRAEHWVVVHGTAEVTVGAQTRLVQENESVYVPMGVVHRLRNPGRIDLEIIEVQVGSYTGEDDIVRLEDPYKR